MTEFKRSYYAIIPANVRYDKTLPAAAKLLYGEITALCSQNGKCWAENTYFAELYEADKRSVRRWIEALIEKGYLRREIEYKDDGKTVLKRCISIAENASGCEQKCPADAEKASKRGEDNVPSYGQKCPDGEDKNVRHLRTKMSTIIIQENNTMNNTISKPTPGHLKQRLEQMINETELPEKVKASLFKWLEYKKYKYSEMGFKALLSIAKKKVVEYGADAAVELIEECISNTWKGIIWEKLLRRATAAPLKIPKQRNYDEE